jgi:glucosamine 6-phosphate synthetase-like amidotransferase/phosphosugar isomerase protein
MCAIFGFIASKNQPVDVDVLKRIVTANIGRGPHAFGLSWIDGRGVLHCFKQAGRLTDRLGVLAMARHARLLVGHLRYATHGDPAENVNNHPHPADGGWIVHNGVVTNYESLLSENGLWPVSECDSEAIGLLYERADGTRLRRMSDVIPQTSGGLAVMGLWTRPNALLVARRGNPLHAGLHKSGLYLATMERGLPGRVQALRDNTVRQFRPDRPAKVRTLESGGDVESTLYDPATYRGG